MGPHQISKERRSAVLEFVNSTNDYPLGSKVLSSIQKPSMKVKFISASSDFAVNA